MDNIHPPNISNAFSIKKNVIFCLYLTEETLGNGNLTTKDPHVPPVLMPVKTNSAVSKIYYDKTHYCLWQKKVYFLFLFVISANPCPYINHYINCPTLANTTGCQNRLVSAWCPASCRCSSEIIPIGKR